MVLATLVIALLRGGIVVLGGAPENASSANNFAALAVGGLVGFGIREVIGWLGNLAQSTFPTGVQSKPGKQQETRHA